VPLEGPRLRKAVLRVRLIHWSDDEAEGARARLESLGYVVEFRGGDGASVIRHIRASAPPDAFVIDFTRLPSHGREVGRVLRSAKATRHVPVVFVGGADDKVDATRALLPDATYTTWGRIRTTLARAIAHPPAAPVVPGDVMSARPLVDKLGMKPGFRVCLIGSPKGFADTLTPLPPKTTFTARPDAACDLFLVFMRTLRELAAHTQLLRDHIDRQTLWLIWPKKASGVLSELDGNAVRLGGLAAGWVDFKVCAVDATWSGLAFKRQR